MKQIVLFFLMVCAFSSNAQFSAVITAEQPVLGFNDSTETVVSVELSDYHRNGLVVTPIEFRRSNIQTLIKLGGLGIGMCTKFGTYDQFRFGGTGTIFPVGLRKNPNLETEYTPTWMFAPTMNANCYISWDIVDNSVHRFGVKITGEMDFDLMVNKNLSPSFGIRAGIYYSFLTEAVFPAQIQCPGF